MDSKAGMNYITRRQLLQGAGTLAGGAVLARLFSAVPAQAAWYGQQPAVEDQVAKMRAMMGGTPIQPQQLADHLTLLSGPGGNVVVLDGPDGKLMVDTFVQPAFANLRKALADIGPSPIKTVIDTHWHFDHTDNNASLHELGAHLIAHENTKKRMSETHQLAVLNLDFPPSPAAALPQQTFKENLKLQVNGENLALSHFAPAHTDSDICVHFQKANVLQTGDTFFNGMFPYIDGGTGGSVKGMIAACTKSLSLADNNTKIIPGHGPLGNKADLAKFRDMLTTVEQRVGKLKSAGKSADEVVAAKPLADLDAVWGKGLFNAEVFTRLAYMTV